MGRYVLYRVICHVLRGLMLFVSWGFCHQVTLLQYTFFEKELLLSLSVAPFHSVRHLLHAETPSTSEPRKSSRQPVR